MRGEGGGGASKTLVWGRANSVVFFFYPARVERFAFFFYEDTEISNPHIYPAPSRRESGHAGQRSTAWPQIGHCSFWHTLTRHTHCHRGDTLTSDVTGRDARARSLVTRVSRIHYISLPLRLYRLY